MKKFLVLIMAILLVFTLTGCGDSGGSSSGGGGGGGGGDDPVSSGPLCFTAKTAGSTIKLKADDINPPAANPTVEYSTDGSTWEAYTLDTVITLENQNDKVYFRGDNDTFCDSTGFMNFVMTGSIAASGNIMSLVDKTCASVTIPNSMCFNNLFQNCAVLTTPPALPATTLTGGCYDSLFFHCSGLTTAPALPATTLQNCCYMGMFWGCSSLTTPPVLPATTVVEECYEDMFYDCSALTSAPELPATTMQNLCYSSMFYGCTSLTTAPVLPATTLATNCYSGMFQDCANLTSITVYFTSWDTVPTATTSWIGGVSFPATGTFNCPAALADEVDGDNKKPTGWTKTPL